MSIKEFTWIRFLITDYESNIVKDDVDSNLKATEEIEMLENHLKYLKTLNTQLEEEKRKSDKFFNQYNYFNYINQLNYFKGLIFCLSAWNRRLI